MKKDDGEDEFDVHAPLAANLKLPSKVKLIVNLIWK